MHNETTVHISPEAADRMMAALDAPREPNELLQQALVRRQQLLSGELKLEPNPDQISIHQDLFGIL